MWSTEPHKLLHQDIAASTLTTMRSKRTTRQLTPYHDLYIKDITSAISGERTLGDQNWETQCCEPFVLPLSFMHTHWSMSMVNTVEQIGR